MSALYEQPHPFVTLNNKIPLIDEKRWETLLATEKQDLAPLDRFGHSAVLADDDTVVTFGGSSREGTKTKTNSLLRLRLDEGVFNSFKIL